MTFGDWELFRIVIISLREQERTSFTTFEEGSRSVRFTVQSEINRKGIMSKKKVMIIYIYIIWIFNLDYINIYRPQRYSEQ